jgi:phosphate transport system substrate-binding protein
MKNTTFPAVSFLAQAAIIGLLCALSISASAQSAIRLHGSVVLKGLIDSDSAGLAEKAGARIETVGNGSDNGLLDVVEGRADVALLLAPLEDIARKINTRKPGTVNVAELKTVSLGYSKVVLIVNPRNPVRRLTDQQATGLLTGQINNWKDVGGLDQMVIVVMPPEGNGLRATVESVLLKGQRIRGAQTEYNTALVRNAVAQSPRAIGCLGAAMLSDKIAVVSTDTEMISPALFVVRGTPSVEVQRLAEALRPLVK